MSLWWGIGVSLPTCGAFGARYLIPCNSLVEAFAQGVGLSDADGSLPLGGRGLVGWMALENCRHHPWAFNADLKCGMSFPQHRPFFFPFFLMSVIIKYFYRAQKSQNSAKHLTVMHPWEPLLWGGEVQTHRYGAEGGCPSHAKQDGVGRGHLGGGGGRAEPPWEQQLEKGCKH